MPLLTAHAHSPAEHLDAPVIVHSHLRWDFVWQRPQQLLSRLSRTNRVLFVEEPIYVDDLAAARLDLSVPQPHVHRAVPVLPASLRGRYDDSIVVIRELLHRQADDGLLGKLFRRPVQWFYTPMPAPAMIGAFGERAVVYDCMDELSKFRFAPTELTDREAFLMSKADVVFTGGYRLWESKAQHHGNVHFFGCGVDVAHFGSSMCDTVEVPAEIARLGGKVIGYYGVIDERIDYDLLRTLARSLPDTALVMVGPVVKVDPRELPQAPNIHWLGQREYAALPAHVKGFDVCLMPFALNEATEYINPTKTLEYMAAGKPIVSTAIYDVVHHFRPVVAVAHSHDEFVACVRSAVAAPDETLIERGLELARGSSWECIVADMKKIVRAAIATRAVVLNEVKDLHLSSEVQVLRSAPDDARPRRHPARTQALALASEATGT
jgi:glycosyltransferase involved in cell wall biosynthesis